MLALRSSAVLVVKILFWTSLVLLAWTHVLYPACAELLARVATRRVRAADIEPTVAVIVAAYNEEPVIGRRIQNLLELDYPRDKLQLVVTSDASTDRTEEIALQYPEVTVIPNPRGGKVAAQDRAVRQTDSEIVAFSDANATWSADALRTLVRAFADPDVAYVCGQLRILQRRRLEQGRLVLALRDGRPRCGVEARLGHRRQRLDLCAAPLRLRRGRPALRARPLAPVPDGAARTARRLRAGRARAGRSRRRRTRPSTGARCACSSTAG